MRARWRGPLTDFQVAVTARTSWVISRDMVRTLCPCDFKRGLNNYLGGEDRGHSSPRDGSGATILLGFKDKSTEMNSLSPRLCWPWRCVQGEFMATLSEPEPSLAVSWTPGREGALRLPPCACRPAPPGLCLGGRPGGRWPARCEREPHVQQALPSTASSSSARPRRVLLQHRLPWGRGRRHARERGDAGRGGPPGPAPSQLRPVESADAACDADAERARPVGPVWPSYRRLERVPAAIPMGRGPRRATTSQAARRPRAEAAVPLPAWAPSRRREPARRISVPSGFRGAHRTPQTSPALMTFIPCAPAPGRPGHPSRHLGKTLRGLEGEWQRDGRTWFREPAPAWTCLGLAPSACPKGAKGKGARGGRGRHRRRGRLGLCCSLSWVQPPHCEV